MDKSMSVWESILVSSSFASINGAKKEDTLCLVPSVDWKAFQGRPSRILEGTYVRWDWIMVVAYEAENGFNHKKHILPRINVEECVLTVRESRDLYSWSVIA